MKIILFAAAVVAAVSAPAVSASPALPSAAAAALAGDFRGAVRLSIGDALVYEDFVTEPRAPWGPADEADSIYRDARRALDRGDYARAAGLFARLHEEFPKSRYAADAPYWQAFALYREGGASSLRDALSALDKQRTEYPNAATRGDARSLETRIRGQLANRGDAESAEQIAEAAREAADQAREGNEEGRTGRASRGSQSGRACADEDEDDRVAAINALMQMSAERALPILRRVLARRDACSEVLRRKAVFIIAQHPTSETEDILTGVLRDDPDREVREQAVFWLSQVNTEKAVTTLENVLRTSNDTEIREKALFALSQHRNPRAMELLRGYAGNESAPGELREKAIFWLGQRRSAENTTFLRTLYGKLEDQELKEKVIFSLSQMGGDDNRQWLMDVALNEKESTEMRKKALFWVGQSGAALQPLVALYDRMKDRELKEQLIFVYSQRRETAAVDKLLAIAKNEQDRDLRKKAIFWLSQSRDPRVAQFLQDLIDQ